MQLNIFYGGRVLNRLWLYGSAVVLLLIITGFSLFYLTSDYAFLVKWWIGLDGCFYRQKFWTQDFFSRDVKIKGNYYCALALVLSLAAIVYYIRQALKCRLSRKVIIVRLSGKDIFFLIAGATGLLFMWLWGKHITPVVGDEVRSALLCADLHPFQTLSYYMLPNNHVLFNLLNNLFFPFVQDKVISGKLISLAAYLAFAALVYFWYRRLTQSRIVAFFSVLLLAMQFPVWGFSFEGRGYELYNLAAWFAFIGLFEYERTGKKSWHGIHAISCVIGYAIVPTFLFVHLAFVFYYAAHNLLRRRVDFEYWKSQVILGFFTFCFYLPILCFSGLQSLTENRFVRPSAISLKEFFTQPSPVRSYIDYWFSWFESTSSNTSLILFFIPLFLLMARRKSLSFRMGLFYLFLLLSFIALLLITKRYPYHRALIANFSLGLGIFIYALYRFSYAVGRRLRNAVAGRSLFLLMTAGLIVHFVHQNTKHLLFVLYFDDMNYFYHTVSDSLDEIPAGSSIGFTDESFNWRYLSKNKPLRSSPCLKGIEDYLIVQESDPVPDSTQYLLVKNVLQYSIYRKRQADTGPR